MVKDRVYAFARQYNFTYFAPIDKNDSYLFIEFNTEDKEIEIRTLKLSPPNILSMMRNEPTIKIFDNPATKRIVEESKYYKYIIWEAIFEYGKMK